MEEYAAGIVLYNPDLKRLKENLDAVSIQVKKIYCYNNGLKEFDAVAELIGRYENAVLIGQGKNVGIATALNKLIEKADQERFEWILTLDQDSVLCDGMVKTLAALKNEEKAAIICPVIEDVRRKIEKPPIISETTEDVDFCITSGSFMNVKITQKIGGFDDYLFIGLVDNEICYRVKLNGYRIIRNNAVVLNHELGNLRPSRFENVYLKLGDWLHSETIKKLSYKREVSPMRLYYATRNMFYLKKRYKNYMSEQMWNKKIIMNSASSIIRGGVQLDIIKALFAGVRDGKAVSTEPLSIVK